MSEGDIDPADLQRQLAEIKGAMGIAERSEVATSIWLLLGISVPLAAAVSQYVHLEQLPPILHSVVWTVFVGGGFATFAFLTDTTISRDRTAGKPNLWFQFGLVYLAFFPLSAIVSAYVGELSYTAESALRLSIIVVLIGVAYGVMGTALEAYYVRRRDRWLLYAGTVWMVALGVAIPQSAFLETWAYAVFGALYFVYALLAYAVMTGVIGER